MINLTSPITGTAQTGFTAPTYTLTSDQAPDTNGRQFAVTAVGGTQVGVTTHSGSSPFTITYWKAKLYKMLGIQNPVTGVIRDVPNNSGGFIVRKGMTPLAGQPIRVGDITIKWNIPSGCDVNDAPNVRAMFSAAIGALSQQSAGIGDTAVTNIL
jgi:hypothetical protein